MLCSAHLPGPSVPCPPPLSVPHAALIYPAALLSHASLPVPHAALIYPALLSHASDELSERLGRLPSVDVRGGGAGRLTFVHVGKMLYTDESYAPWLGTA